MFLVRSHQFNYRLLWSRLTVDDWQWMIDSVRGLSVLLDWVIHHFHLHEIKIKKIGLRGQWHGYSNGLLLFSSISLLSNHLLSFAWNVPLVPLKCVKYWQRREIGVNGIEIWILLSDCYHVDVRYVNIYCFLFLHSHELKVLFSLLNDLH